MANPTAAGSGTPSGSDFQTAVKQEEAYLRRVHPTPEDIPTCMNLFDTYLDCSGKHLFTSTLGCVSRSTVMRSQIKSLYRYGERRQCNGKLEDFKFCMSCKFMEPEEKYEAWISRRSQWWAKRRLAKSSEDVWALREYVEGFFCSLFHAHCTRIIGNL